MAVAPGHLDGGRRCLDGLHLVAPGVGEHVGNFEEPLAIGRDQRWVVEPEEEVRQSEQGWKRSRQLALRRDGLQEEQEEEEGEEEVEAGWRHLIYDECAPGQKSSKELFPKFRKKGDLDCTLEGASSLAS